ncbi:kinesin-like protein KIN-UC [Citrus sinensis]|nr:kinesin-like protein KIN-UC [Citrus sinensis]
MAASGSSSLRATASRERHNHIPPSSHSSSRNLNNGPIHNHSVRTSKERPSSASSSTSSSSSSFRRSVTPNHRIHPSNNYEDPGRVRVAVRLRPRNAEDLLSDTDFADCVELQPELKRLRLRKNNWSSESYRFDEVFTETASQRRVYEVVAKPVVESVLNGYNGTVMAYGQTGTGKTYTLGRLGKDDASERGIMVRALEDIISSMSVTSDSVEVSYLQLYMESIQDLLAPEKVNIPINEDPKTGEVSLPGATVVKLRDLDHLLQLLQVGEVNRHAANTKLNTESSRSHAILVVYIRRSVHEIIDKITSEEKDTRTELPGDNHVPLVRKSKLLIVDLAGSERIDKSGSEGPLLEEAKFINLSLSSLGKCINALAENSPHIPTRDSKLTRLLRDSFGGSARTSLIITVGPSARNHAETTSTIMFGQRAMKVVNMVKLKEEFDYESLCRKLETQVDHLTAEIERKQKLRENDKCELEKLLRECQISYDEAKDNLVTQVELLTAKIEMQQKLRENDKYEFEKQLRESQISYDESMRNLVTRSEFLEKENAHLELEVEKILGELNHQKDQNNLKREKIVQLEISLKNSKQQQLDNSSYQKVLADTTQMYEKKITELIKQLEIEHARSEGAEEQVDTMKKLISDNQKSIEQYEMENSTYQKALADTTQLYEKKIAELNKKLEDEHACFEGAVEQLDMGQKEVHELCVKLKETRQLHESAVYEVQTLKSEYKNLLEEKETMSDELQAARQRLLVEEKQRKAIEYELVKLKKTAPEHDDDFEDKKPYTKDYISKGSSRFGAPMSLQKSNPSRELSVGLPKILQLLTSEDPDVQIHAVKVVANLAAEDINQEKIVEEGGLDALLLLLRTSQNTTILRVASGAIANLAMNEMNQGLIMSRGGGQLLAKTASKTDDPQTLRMVAGALANLCGNEKLHTMLEEDGAIKALLAMVRSGNIDVIAQVARGLANFAKCESRAIVQGQRKGRSHLMEDSALEWLIANSKTNSASTRRHVELALCHLAQNEDNARDFISRGGAKELVQISIESSREDIRNLAKKTMKSNPRLQADTHA